MGYNLPSQSQLFLCSSHMENRPTEALFECTQLTFSPFIVTCWSRQRTYNQAIVLLFYKISTIEYFQMPVNLILHVNTL